MPCAVRRDERVGDVDRIAQRLLDRERAASDPRRQRLAVQQLHDQVGHIPAIDLGDTDVMHRADAGMGQLRDRARLALEPFPAARRHVDLRREDLDGDEAVEPRIARSIDLAHAAGPEERQNLESAETRAGGEPG